MSNKMKHYLAIMLLCQRVRIRNRELQHTPCSSIRCAIYVLSYYIKSDSRIHDDQRHAPCVRSRMKLLISCHQFSCLINRKRARRAAMIDALSSLIRVPANETKGTCCEASSGDWWARDLSSASLPARIAASRFSESCHCTGCSRLLRVLAGLHPRTVRVKKLAFGDQARGSSSGARGSRVFCSRNTVSLESVTGRARIRAFTAVPAVDVHPFHPACKQ